MNLHEGDLPPQQSKRAVVMGGRLNPPTAGHYAVIDRMKGFVREHKGITPIIMIIASKESAKDLGRNPLSGEDREKFIRASGRANGVPILIASNMMEGFAKVREAGYEPYAIAAGSDRASKYIELLDKYFTGPNGEKLEHIVMPGLKDREDPDDDGTPSEEILEIAEEGGEIPVYMISGSMARLAVKLGKKRAFAKILGVKQELADLIFKKVQGPVLAAAEEEERKDQEKKRRDEEKAAKAAAKAARAEKKVK